MTEDETRIKALGAKVELLADLKLRAEQRLEAADEEIAQLRAEVHRLEGWYVLLNQVLAGTANPRLLSERRVAEREVGISRDHTGKATKED